MNDSEGCSGPERLVIIRHGRSEQNAVLDLLDPPKSELERLVNVRDADIALTEEGVWQSKKTGAYLAQTQPVFDACFTSPYRRAVETAQHILSELNYTTPLYKDNRLREKEFGMLYGLTKQAMRAQYPEVIRARERDGKFWHRSPGGENYPDVEQRIKSIYDDFQRDWKGKSILVITHQVPYLMFLAIHEHLDEQQVLTLGDVPNCAIQEYIIEENRIMRSLKGTQFNFTVYPKFADLEPKRAKKWGRMLIQ